MALLPFVAHALLGTGGGRWRDRSGVDLGVPDQQRTGAGHLNALAIMQDGVQERDPAARPHHVHRNGQSLLRNRPHELIGDAGDAQAVVRGMTVDGMNEQGRGGAAVQGPGVPRTQRQLGGLVDIAILDKHGVHAHRWRT